MHTQNRENQVVGHQNNEVIITYNSGRRHRKGATSSDGILPKQNFAEPLALKNVFIDFFKFLIKNTTEIDVDLFFNQLLTGQNI